MVNGKLLHGLLHPEMGHIRIPHDLITDPFPGCCPFRGGCFEGLASGMAVAQRWGRCNAASASSRLAARSPVYRPGGQQFHIDPVAAAHPGRRPDVAGSAFFPWSAGK